MPHNQLHVQEDNYDRLAGLSNAYLCDLDRDGVARKIGVWEDSEQQRWLFIQPVGKPLDKVIQGNGKLLCDIICQVTASACRFSNAQVFQCSRSHHDADNADAPCIRL